MSDVPEPAGVLVMRAWVEPPGQLRVRVTTAAVWSSSAEEVRTAAGLEPAVAIVRQWLQELSDRG